jgi:hypothetical protein
MTTGAAGRRDALQPKRLTTTSRRRGGTSWEAKAMPLSNGPRIDRGGCFRSTVSFAAWLGWWRFWTAPRRGNVPDLSFRVRCSPPTPSPVQERSCSDLDDWQGEQLRRPRFEMMVLAGTATAERTRFVAERRRRTCSAAAAETATARPPSATKGGQALTTASLCRGGDDGACRCGSAAYLWTASSRAGRDGAEGSQGCHSALQRTSVGWKGSSPWHGSLSWFQEQ